VEDSLLGFAVGMMLAASAFSLLLPGLDATTKMLESKALGVLLMLGLDQFTSYEHDKTGPCGPGNERCTRIWLFVFALALHDISEGLATLVWCRLRAFLCGTGGRRQWRA